MTSYYPDKISARLKNPGYSGESRDCNAKGREVSFECGVSVSIYLRIDPDKGSIDQANFKTNGCGFAIAAADGISEWVMGRRLTDLHGLEDLNKHLESDLGVFPAGRSQCLRLGLDALKRALAEYRSRLVEEWTGEKALICTCFGISEEAIENLVRDHGASDVEEVGKLCNAGTGCGSCQFLIREVIDSESITLNETVG